MELRWFPWTEEDLKTSTIYLVTVAFCTEVHLLPSPFGRDWEFVAPNAPNDTVEMQHFVVNLSLSSDWYIYCDTSLVVGDLHIIFARRSSVRNNVHLRSHP